MDVAMVGLGRMGGNMARRLLRGGHRVVVWNRTYAKAEELGAEGAEPVRQLTDVVKALEAPRAIWIMLPYGDATQAAIDELTPLLDEGDILIDGGNSPFQHDIQRGAELAEHGIRYLDAGTSGGVWGLEVGYCLMVGGDRSAFEHRRAAPQDPRAARPRLRVLRRPRLRALRQDGPQRHRVRHDAGLRRGLRASRGDRVGPRPRVHRRPVEPGQRGAQLAARAGRRRVQEGPGAGAHHGLRGGHRRGPLDGGAGDRPLACPCRRSPRRCSCASARARTTRSAARSSRRCATSSAATPSRRRSDGGRRGRRAAPFLRRAGLRRRGRRPRHRAVQGRRGGLAVRRRAPPGPLQPGHVRGHGRPRAPQADPGAVRPRLSRRAAVRHHAGRLRPPGDDRRPSSAT